MTRRSPTTPEHTRSRQHASPPVYPFTAVVGQEEMKLALLLNVIAPSIGGVLIMGHRGTGKSTAVRALADLLPPITKVRGCAYGCDPLDGVNLCADCEARLAAGGRLPRERAPVTVVDLPLGATEDRVCGTINIERAVTEGVKAFEPGLLARAHRGFLYIDEVNLLEDHLVDLLLDAAATGRNRVEREGISIEHPSRFVLVGSGNPEEGELRPQLLDRFGLFTEVRTGDDLEQRVAIVERREAFERDPVLFKREVDREEVRLRRRLARAQRTVGAVEVPRSLVHLIAHLCIRLGVEGHRGELTMARAARALAAFEGRPVASEADVRRVAAMSLRHRLRRDPLERMTGASRIEQALEELFGAGVRADNKERETTQTERGEKPLPDSTESDDGGNARREPRHGSAEHDRTARGEDRVAPPVDARLPEDALDSVWGRGKRPRAAPAPSARRGHDGARSSVSAKRGRYARSTVDKPSEARIALDATLRAAAASQVGRLSQSRPFLVTRSDLRFKQFRRKSGTLFILAIDTSGSMAMNRISQAKGALSHLLRQSYIERDRVALISFRQRGAELLLPPSQSPARARRILDALPVGGATPLAAGLLRSLEVAQRAAARQGTEQIVLLVFTDGHANVSLQSPEAESRTTQRRRITDELEQIGAALRNEGVRSVVVDTRNRFTSDGEGQALADALGGRHLYLPLGASDRPSLRDLVAG